MVSFSYVQGQPADWSVTASVRAAREAGVPETSLNRLLMLAVDHRLEDDGVVRLVNFLQTVQTENLPIDPFMGKIEEGLAKQVPLNTIAAVLAQKLDDYRFVKTVLARTKTAKDQEISHQDLNRMIGSLDAGGLPGDVGQVHSGSINRGSINACQSNREYGTSQTNQV